MKKFLFAFAFALLTLTVPSYALEVDFSQKILDADGKPFRECSRLDESNTKCVELVDVTLGLLSGYALALPSTDPHQAMPLDQSVKRGMLAIDTKKNKVLDLAAEDIALIKDSIGKLPINKIEIARAIQMLDQMKDSEWEHGKKAAEKPVDTNDPPKLPAPDKFPAPLGRPHKE